MSATVCPETFEDTILNPASLQRAIDFFESRKATVETNLDALYHADEAAEGDGKTLAALALGIRPLESELADVETILAGLYRMQGRAG